MYCFWKQPQVLIEVELDLVCERDSQLRWLYWRRERRICFFSLPIYIFVSLAIVSKVAAKRPLGYPTRHAHYIPPKSPGIVSTIQLKWYHLAFSSRNQHANPSLKLDNAQLWSLSAILEFLIGVETFFKVPFGIWLWPEPLPDFGARLVWAIV